MVILSVQSLRKTFLVFIIATTALVACVNKKTIFTPAEPSAEKGSVLYVYRPSKTTNVMQTPKLSIAGVKTFEISSGEYRQLYLMPGKYAVKLHAIKDSTRAVEHELLVAKDRIHYLRVDASMKFEMGQTYQPYQRKFGLTEVAPELARVEIGSLKDMDGGATERRKKLAGSNVTGGEGIEEEDATFSVGKTSNPFSH